MPVHHYQIVELKQAMGEQFNLSELEELCFDLGIEWEDVRKKSKSSAITSLIGHAKRHNFLWLIRISWGAEKNLPRINANLHKLQKLVKISVNSLQKLIV